MLERVVIIGAGQAGAQVAVSLRQLGFGGKITLLGEERQLPYQRPPLSKAYLSGEMPLERTWLRSEGYYAKHGIDLGLGVRAERILRDEQVVCTDRGRIDYDALAICTGADARRLGVPGGCARRWRVQPPFRACSICARSRIRIASGPPSDRA